MFSGLIRPTMRRLRLAGETGAAVAAMLLTLAPDPGQAQSQIIPTAGGVFYLGGEGGWTLLAGAAAAATIPVIGFRSDRQSWHDGFNVGGRAGYEWGPWRFEEEIRYQRNDDHKLVNSAGRGDYAAAAFMSNLIYDFASASVLSPHIGAGVGAVYLNSSLNVTGLGQVVTGSDWVLGYQAIAGLRYMISPSIAADLDYRYLGTATPHFRTGADFVDAGIPAPGVHITSGYNSHSIVASLVMRFGAAAAPPPFVPTAPPPVAAPPAAPAAPATARRVFLVFFDWDRDTIGPQGRRILRQAAAAWHAGAPVVIRIAGYADRSGAAGYNQRLSERRAGNVARGLEEQGIARRQMAVGGRGENDNRVPTADGVREPQNRRVEIVFP